MITFRKLGKYGRLGNQMFQIAATIGIARANDTDYAFNSWEYNSSFIKQLPLADINEKMIPLHEKNFGYSTYELSPDLDYELQGYFQSENYWIDVKDEVLSFFEFKGYVLPLYGVTSTVSIHVRRGDYLNLPNYHHNLTMNYYEEAMSKFPGAAFFIFSDDIKWCDKAFSTYNNKKDITIVTSRSEIDNMRLMSQCQHNIIANSSFSWWGAYLNPNPDKIVIAPKQWFGKDGPKDTQDLIPKDWILI